METRITILTAEPNETLETLMVRMEQTVNEKRDAIGYSIVRAMICGIELEAYGIQQGRNRHNAMQIRWYVNRKTVARKNLAQRVCPRSAA